MARLILFFVAFVWFVSPLCSALLCSVLTTLCLRQLGSRDGVQKHSQSNVCSVVSLPSKALGTLHLFDSSPVHPSHISLRHPFLYLSTTLRSRSQLSLNWSARWLEMQKTRSRRSCLRTNKSRKQTKSRKSMWRESHTCFTIIESRQEKTSTFSRTARKLTVAR